MRTVAERAARSRLAMRVGAWVELSHMPSIPDPGAQCYSHWSNPSFPHDLVDLVIGDMDWWAHRHQMFPLSTLEAAVFDIAHLVRITPPEHLGHQAIIVGRLVARMGVLELAPVIGQALLEDSPVPKGLCHHWVAPS
jgi:hypothetical protein